MFEYYQNIFRHANKKILRNEDNSNECNDDCISDEELYINIFLISFAFVLFFAALCLLCKSKKSMKQSSWAVALITIALITSIISQLYLFYIYLDDDCNDLDDLTRMKLRNTFVPSNDIESKNDEVESRDVEQRSQRNIEQRNVEQRNELQNVNTEIIPESKNEFGWNQETHVSNGIDISGTNPTRQNLQRVLEKTERVKTGHHEGSLLPIGARETMIRSRKNFQRVKEYPDLMRSCRFAQ
jgi:hypothetical protein